MADSGTISRLTEIGLTGTRFWIPIQQIFATSSPNFNYLDQEIEKMKSAGLHPIAVIDGTPHSLGASACAPPSSTWQWGHYAAELVAHVDQKFPGYLQDYEIWNEPELSTSLCISNATTRLNTYISMFYEAASQMHAQAKADGQPIRTGGPAISQLSLASTWIPALLHSSYSAPYVDFVSFHLYITGQNEINRGMTWSSLYSYTQSSTQGLAHYYKMVESLVRAGYQPNPASTPIYISEYNDNWVFSVDCCRNNPTYGSLWNSVAITDFLNVVYSGTSAVPTRLSYFNSAGSYFCIMGEWDSKMDCNASAMEPYPQFFAFKLFASPEYLDLQTGGHMAASVSPASTTSGLTATAFYTSTADNVVVVNPTSTNYSAVNINFIGPGITSWPKGVVYLLNASHGQISSESATVRSISGGYAATVEVPPYSTVALSLKGSQAGSAPKAILAATPTSGTHPVSVYVNSSASQAGGSFIVGRTIDFGDGKWLSGTPAISHIYYNPGSYTIRLTIKDQNGLISTASTVVTVH
jgi:PKD repeat protein